MKPARFLAEAEAELQAEAAYYEQRAAGLGHRFLSEVQAALRVACEMPAIGSPHRHGTRRVYPRRFPFSIVYLVRGDEVIVLAIAPFSRRPDYWRGRSHDG